MGDLRLHADSSDSERLLSIKVKRGWRLWRKIIKIGLIVGFILMLPTFYIIIWRTWFSEHGEQLPTAFPNQVVPEVQTEGHTCAVHSLNAIYRAYGMDPAEENLRFRLGTDFYSLVWLRDSTGTLHPDIYMVLTQDGFWYQSTTPKTSSDQQVILEHLKSGHLAMALIKRRENQHLHWVVLETGDEGGIRVADSLKLSPNSDGGDDFWQTIVVSVILIRPNPDGSRGSAMFGHLSGAWHTLEILPRL